MTNNNERQNGDTMGFYRERLTEPPSETLRRTSMELRHLASPEEAQALEVLYLAVEETELDLADLQEAQTALVEREEALDEVAEHVRVALREGGVAFDETELSTVDLVLLLLDSLDGEEKSPTTPAGGLPRT